MLEPTLSCSHHDLVDVMMHNGLKVEESSEVEVEEIRQRLSHRLGERAHEPCSNLQHLFANKASFSCHS